MVYWEYSFIESIVLLRERRAKTHEAKANKNVSTAVVLGGVTVK